MTANLILLKFDDTYGAQQAMGAVAALQEMRYAWFEDVAIVQRHHSGRVGIHTTTGSVSEGALFGWLTGGLIGLLFGPVGFLTGIVLGAGAGALIGDAAKRTGIPKEQLEAIKDELGKGTSMLVLVGSDVDGEQFTHAFARYEPSKVIRFELPDATVDSIRSAIEAEPAVRPVVSGPPDGD